ncbi:MAG: hypothetical protein WCP92_08985 [bacterium]
MGGSDCVSNIVSTESCSGVPSITLAKKDSCIAYENLITEHNFKFGTNFFIKRSDVYTEDTTSCSVDCAVCGNGTQE